MAAHKVNLEIVKLLVEGGADINSKNEDKASAIALAAKAENAPLVTYLQENGAE